MNKSSNAFDGNFGGLFTLLPENSPQEIVQPSQAIPPEARCVLQELLFEFLVLRPDTLAVFLKHQDRDPLDIIDIWTSTQELILTAPYRIREHEPIEKKKWSSGNQFPPEPWNAVVSQFQPFLM